MYKSPRTRTVTKDPTSPHSFQVALNHLSRHPAHLSTLMTVKNASESTQVSRMRTYRAVQKLSTRPDLSGELGRSRSAGLLLHRSVFLQGYCCPLRHYCCGNVSTCCAYTQFCNATAVPPYCYDSVSDVLFVSHQRLFSNFS